MSAPVMAILEAFYGTIIPSEIRDQLQQFLVDIPSVVVTFLASYFPTASDLLYHIVTQGTTVEQLPLIREGARQRWQTYCQQVERRVRGEEEPTTTSVFGTCRRCGSARLLVTTRQLRRADEGMTEIRRCRDCGHVTKVNS